MRLASKTSCSASIVFLLSVTGPSSAEDGRALSMADIAGTWNVENPTDNHDLSGTKTLQLSADGTASLKHERMTFNRRWKLASGQITITDPPGQVPGPAKRFQIVDVGEKQSRLRLKSDYPRSAKDVLLVRAN
jgi:hypothetical protein